MSKKLALIIGNAEYDDERLAQLRTPQADVSALADVLRHPQIGGFDNVETYVNESEAKLRRVVALFFREKGHDDLLLLYFSGHGVLDEDGRLYLATKDTERDSLSASAIPAAFVSERMDRSRSKRQVLILDCCHSGAFARGAKGAPGSSVGTASAFAGAGFGRFVLTATDSIQYAWEGDRVSGVSENSVFTNYLIKGLRTGEADLNSDGEITLDELYDYVYEKVLFEKRLQTPSKWTYGQQGEIVIANNPSTLHPVTLPPDVMDAISSRFPIAREHALPELECLLSAKSKAMRQIAREALTKLVDDDSRRVSAAASVILAKYSITTDPVLPPNSDAVPRTVSEVPNTMAPAEMESVSTVENVGNIEVSNRLQVGLDEPPQRSNTSNAVASVERQEKIKKKNPAAVVSFSHKSRLMSSGIIAVGCSVSFGLLLLAVSHETAGLGFAALVSGLIGTGYASLKWMKPTVSMPDGVLFGCVWAASIITFLLLSSGLYVPYVTRNMAIIGFVGATFGYGTLLVLGRIGFSVERKVALGVSITWSIIWPLAWAATVLSFNSWRYYDGEIGLFQRFQDSRSYLTLPYLTFCLNELHVQNLIFYILVISFVLGLLCGYAIFGFVTRLPVLPSQAQP